MQHTVILLSDLRATDNKWKLKKGAMSTGIKDDFVHFVTDDGVLVSFAHNDVKANGDLFKVIQ